MPGAVYVVNTPYARVMKVEESNMDTHKCLSSSPWFSCALQCPSWGGNLKAALGTTSLHKAHFSGHHSAVQPRHSAVRQSCTALQPVMFMLLLIKCDSLTYMQS